MDRFGDLKSERFDTYISTGIFEEKVRGVSVGFFVGWRQKYGSGAQNIRRGLYFYSAAEAGIFRDSIEKGRKISHRVCKQVG